MCRLYKYLYFNIYIFNICWHVGFCALLYPTNSEYGIFMAISVPIDLPHRNVFISYNYEFNYYQPEHVYKYPPILMGDFQDSYLTYDTITPRNCENCKQSARPVANQNSTTEEAHKSGRNETKEAAREKRAVSLISRTSFYAVLKDKLERSGYPGEACLLRTICETNASLLGDINGFLGNLVHIIFSPSSSRDENLPNEYYNAEIDGRNNECESYKRNCTENILDFISTPLEQILNDISSRRL
ncbi:uncharacterized protein LOC115634729 [Scaptodrosophila lebanonensis]|uniref:Uncharacterized protein LOC115634729 n=1 Tax=Drosophila lebanonensis TaxID=7225 RepID=A0A6J2UM33_DROLE|nr:uncharacterized protein LOC115634729 [Scaptodrosophila lebanonensis]